MPVVLVHIQNEDPVLGEVDALPSPTDMLVIVKNPRRRDGKDLPYLDHNVSTVMWPMARINYIEVIPTGEEDDIISFVRD
jgi:hypothetical protein